MHRKLMVRLRLTFIPDTHLATYLWILLNWNRW
jgi:hypothetical protein